ncbi:MAG: hypothetical protein LBB28_00835 [Synergistaceae bacterium]|jgi:uncharacterized Zn finger protein|nr:hypothetical protein [Synergistaceae bacterium]
MIAKKKGRPPGIKSRRAFEPPRWWTAGLISHLAGAALPKQINTAKNYARAGRVVELNVLPGLVSAKVQGKRKAPYLIRIKFPRPDDCQLRDILTALHEKAIYRCMLLSGEMPRDLGGIFRSAGAPLSMDGFLPLQQMCTCSEPEEICKHILAVLYVAADVFDHDPFALLKLKGLEKKALMEFLCAPIGWRGTFPSSDDASCEEKGHVCPPISAQPERGAHPPAPDTSFYGSPELPGELSRDGVSAEGSIYPVPMSEFPMWRGEVSFVDSVAPYYKAVKNFFSGGDAE